MIVEHYLKEKIQPTCSESQNWSKDMIDYFKQKWGEDRRKEKEDLRDDIEDVMESENSCARICSGGLVGNTCSMRDVIIYITQDTKNDL
ncbi:hypothetical protein Tco_0258100 [Tanacetum coccineum]